MPNIACYCCVRKFEILEADFERAIILLESFLCVIVVHNLFLGPCRINLAWSVLCALWGLGSRLEKKTTAVYCCSGI